MHQILSNFTASITELKRNPGLLLDESSGNPIAVLNHNIPVAYLVPADTYAKIIDSLEDQRLVEIIAAREKEYNNIVQVDIDEL